MHSISPLSSALRRALGALVTVAAGLAVPAISQAQAQADPGHDKYRCVVLGDSQACEAAPALATERIEVHTVPGSYARYLMLLGQDAAVAIETARASGEVPMLRTVRITTQHASASEAYKLYLRNGTAGRQLHQVLSEHALATGSPSREQQARAALSQEAGNRGVVTER